MEQYRRRSRSTEKHLAVIGLVACVIFSSAAVAQGFQVERYEPTPAGERLFAVQSPRYAERFGLAAGLTFDLGRDVVLGGAYDTEGNFFPAVSIIQAQLVGHLDLAASAFNRVQLSATLPVTILERGTPGYAVAPISGSAVGDPRIGVTVRLLGQPSENPFSLHLAGHLWIPVGAAPSHAGDVAARGLIRAIAAGQAASFLHWSANAGVLIRQEASLNPVVTGPGSVGSELQLSAALAYVNAAKTLHVGPELLFATAIAGPNPFQRSSTHFELMLGAHYLIAGHFQVGAALGVGVVRSVGTPLIRPILRAAYVHDFAGGETRRHQEPTAEEAPPQENGETRDDVRAKTAPVEEAQAQDKPQTLGETPTKTTTPLAEEAPDKQQASTEAALAEEAPAPTRGSQEKSEDQGFGNAPVDCPEELGAKRIRARTLFFAFNSTDLSPGAEGSLRSLAQSLARHGDRQVFITAYTDAVGDEAFNRHLSGLRARSVERALVSMGVAKSRIFSQGMGVRRSSCAGKEPTADRRVDVDLSER